MSEGRKEGGKMLGPGLENGECVLDGCSQADYKRGRKPKNSSPPGLLYVGDHGHEGGGTKNPHGKHMHTHWARDFTAFVKIEVAQVLKWSGGLQGLLADQYTPPCSLLQGERERGCQFGTQWKKEGALPSAFKSKTQVRRLPEEILGGEGGKFGQCG